jgi:GPI mannosyltransferase 1 subunit X
VPQKAHYSWWFDQTPSAYDERSGKHIGTVYAAIPTWVQPLQMMQGEQPTSPIQLVGLAAGRPGRLSEADSWSNARCGPKHDNPDRRVAKDGGDMSFTFRVHPRKGFHPTLTTSIAATPPTSHCKLFISHKLPPHVIVDQYELALRSKQYSAQIWGNTDLELPFVAGSHGSLLLLRILELSGNTTIELPLHMRYGIPLSKARYGEVPLSSPLPFWACPDHTCGCHSYMFAYSFCLIAFPASPMLPEMPEEIALALHGSGLTPIYSKHGQATSTETILVPIGNPDDLPLIQVVTTIVLLMCSLHMMWAIWSTVTRLHRRVPRKTD